MFCSKADNITPPPQALDWILDLYESVDDIRAHGQTIIYAIHPSAGHLGIFVSGSVAKKEHDEFASNIDLIDVLPPGLYEAVMTPKKEATRPPISSVAITSCGSKLARSKTSGRSAATAEEDERNLQRSARLSEINLGLYRTFVQPWIKLWANDGFRRLDAANATASVCSMRCSLACKPVHGLMCRQLPESVRENREPVSASNVFCASGATDLEAGSRRR